jgi:hypothetical protein
MGARHWGMLSASGGADCRFSLQESIHMTKTVRDEIAQLAASIRALERQLEEALARRRIELVPSAVRQPPAAGSARSRADAIVRSLPADECKPTRTNRPEAAILKRHSRAAAVARRVDTRPAEPRISNGASARPIIETRGPGRDAAPDVRIERSRFWRADDAPRHR